MPADTPRVIFERCKELGAEILRSEGTLVDAGALLAEIDDGYWMLSTLKEPYRVEGKKTMGLELAEQLEWRLPDWIIYPTGGGTGIVGMHKAFDELINGAIGRPMRITDGAGTDVTFNLGKRGFEKPRRGDKPGGYLVPGSCTMFPEVESVRGQIRVGSVFHEYYTALAEPMFLEIDGKIRALSGGGNERFVADRALRRAAGL